MEGVERRTESGAEKTVEGSGVRGEEEEGEESQTGVLGAIAETIVEIAQNTKDLVIGPDDQPNTQSANRRD